jgi:anti-anti-sigma factor
MEFSSVVTRHPPDAHLVGKGELDAFAARRVRERLEDAIDGGCVHFTVDASQITFVDAGGLGMLVGLRNAVVPFGGGVTVTAASERFQRVAKLAGLENAFDLDLLSADGGRGVRPGHDETVRAG